MKLEDLIFEIVAKFAQKFDSDCCDVEKTFNTYLIFMEKGLQYL